MQQHRTHSRLLRAAQIAAALGLVVALGRPAAARNPEDVFRGHIITSSKSIPTYARSKKAYIAKLRKLKTTRFWEDKAKKRWKVYYTAFFTHPLNDLQVKIKIYDVSSGGQHLMSSFEQYVDRRGTRSLTSDVTLDRSDFGVNKKLLMVMESHGHALASARFAILGQGPHYTGKVDFSADDTKGN